MGAAIVVGAQVALMLIPLIEKWLSDNTGPDGKPLTAEEIQQTRALLDALVEEFVD